MGGRREREEERRRRGRDEIEVGGFGNRVVQIYWIILHRMQ